MLIIYILFMSGFQSFQQPQKNVSVNFKYISNAENQNRKNLKYNFLPSSLIINKIDKKDFTLFCLFFVNMKVYWFSPVLKSARDCSATADPTKETNKKK